MAVRPPEDPNRAERQVRKAGRFWQEFATRRQQALRTDLILLVLGLLLLAFLLLAVVRL
jgi:hypothetical protein